MPDFRCQVSDAGGKIRTIVKKADSETEAIRSFSDDEYLLSVEPVIVDRPERRLRTNGDEALEFTQMMALLVDSGLSLKDSLEVAAAMRESGKLASIADSLLESVKKGASFASAVSSRDDLFPPIYRGMVSVGDRVGSVERIFPRLAAYLLGRKTLREKVAGAIAYPILVLAVTALGSFAVVVFLLPQLESVFSGFGAQAAARIQENVRALNLVFLSFSAFIGLAAVSAVAAGIVRRRVDRAAQALDSLALRLPLMGPFLTAMETLNFSFAMETLLAGGVTLETAIAEAAGVVGNRSFRSALESVRSALVRGENVSSAFASRKELPRYLSRWIAVGERTGKTELVFAQIRSYFQAEVDRLTSRFMALIEPALIVGVGVVLLAIVLLLVVPLFSMYGSIL